MDGAGGGALQRRVEAAGVSSGGATPASSKGQPRGHMWEGKRVRKDAGEEGKEEGREERARGARTAAGDLEYGGGRDNSGEQFRRGEVGGEREEKGNGERRERAL